MPNPHHHFSPQDQIVVSLFGAIGILGIGGLAGTPAYAGIGGALLFVISIFLYAKWSRNRSEVAPSNVADMSSKTTIFTEDFPLADGFAEAIITLGARGEIIYANPAAQSLFGVSESGGSFSQTLRQPEVLEIIEAALAGRKPEAVSYHIETPVPRHIRVTATPISTQKKRAGRQRVLLVFYDVTDIVLANTLRSDFLANASHELKTPVASILGYIETLRGHAKDDEEARSRFLVIMQEQAERMQRLINDLLSLRKIEQNEHVAPIEIADLKLATKAAMEAVTPLAKDRNVKISVQKSAPLFVYGIQDELIQLALNLIDNAVQMSSSGSTVELSLTSISQWQPGREFGDTPIVPHAPRRRIVGIMDFEKSYAVLRVRDTGPGFARAHLPRLGERFYRISGDRTNAKKGTGLGLAIVKHIVLRHRGGLFIESQEGVGTEFSIFIPAAPES